MLFFLFLGYSILYFAPFLIIVLFVVLMDGITDATSY